MTAAIAKTKAELRALVLAGETQAAQFRTAGYVPTAIDKARIAQLLEDLCAYGRIALDRARVREMPEGARS